MDWVGQEPPEFLLDCDRRSRRFRVGSQGDSQSERARESSREDKERGKPSTGYVPRDDGGARRCLVSVILNRSKVHLDQRESEDKKNRPGQFKKQKPASPRRLMQSRSDLHVLPSPLPATPYVLSEWQIRIVQGAILPTKPRSIRVVMIRERGKQRLLLTSLHLPPQPDPSKLTSFFFFFFLSFFLLRKWPG